MREAKAQGNFVRFFRLARDAPHMGRQLMRASFASQRASAMKVLLRAHRPSALGSMLQRLLGFETLDACRRYCADHGIAGDAVRAAPGADGDHGDDFVIDCRKAQATFVVEQAAGTRLI